MSPTEEKIVVIGYDMISPLGSETEAQWEAAAAGKSGVGPLTRFALPDNFPVTIAAQVGDVDISDYPFLSPRAMAQWTSPIFLHGMLVCHRALKKIGLDVSGEHSPRTATTFSTAIGGLDANLASDRVMIATGRLPKPYSNPNGCVNMVGGKVSIETGATGPIVTTVTACATGATSMIIGAMFIRAGVADVAICGAVDFPLTEPITAGFATMNGAYKTKDEPTDGASRPFSEGRRGFVIAEGAGAIIISSEKFAAAQGIEPLVELAGWAQTADANHFVAPNRTTVARCMKESIAAAGIEPADIDAINAHAASTKVGDLTEYEAMRDVFGERIPPTSANKSLFGHAMGASSAIESIFAIEGMRREVLLPTINYTPDPEIEIDCVADGARKLSQEFLLKNSFGFGGCNSCLVFKRIN